MSAPKTMILIFLALSLWGGCLSKKPETVTNQIGSDLCIKEQNKTQLISQGQKANFFSPFGKPILNGTIRYQDDFLLFFEKRFDIPLEKNYLIYYLENSSACCPNNSWGMCTAGKKAFYPYTEPTLISAPFEDVHELGHLVFQGRLELPNWFEEVFVSTKIPDVYRYDVNHVGMHTLSKLFKCNDSRNWIASCLNSYEKYDEEVFARCMIRKIDCDYNFDNDELEIDNWVKFVKEVERNGGAGTNKSLFECLEKTYSDINEHIAQLSSALNLSST